MNLSGWFSILVVVPYLNIFFLPYLCLKKGNPESNDYGNVLKYKGPTFLLHLCYAVLTISVAVTGGVLYYLITKFMITGSVF